jgi:predicted NBD/HSP70 family sugar kinase
MSGGVSREGAESAIRIDDCWPIVCGRSADVGTARSIRQMKRIIAKETMSTILVIDVGGTHIKLLTTGMKEPIKILSGPALTAKEMLRKVKVALKDRAYDFVSIGYPAPVVHGRPLREPYNLGGGWVGFNFRKAFDRPVKIMNDAAMQALGSYQGGRLLFLGLGTGLGSAMIVDGVLQPMELAHLPYKRDKSYEDYLGLRGLKRLGRKKWQRKVYEIVTELREALEAEHVVLGGGNSKKLKHLPADIILGSNENAFLGGFRMWSKDQALKAMLHHI